MKARPSPTLAALGMVALLLLPLVESGLNGLLDLSGLPPFVPETGVESLDSALEFARGQLEAADGALEPWRTEPEVPATYFRDGFEPPPAKRLKGPDDWQLGEGWSLDAVAASEGTVGMSFGDAAGFYPVRTGSDTVLHAFLVSPRINLVSMPVPTRLGDTEAGGLAGGNPGGAATFLPIAPSDTQLQGTQATPAFNVSTGELARRPNDITLAFEHAFNLAMDQATSTAIDGARVELFLQDERPTEEQLASGAGAVLPDVLSSGTSSSQALGQGSFVGSFTDIHRDILDLTPYAGRHGYLVFHVATAPKEPLPDHFLSGKQFPVGSPFYGWRLDNVTIAGPAYAEHVVFDRFIQPLPDEGVAGDFVMAPGPQSEVSFVVINRGQVTSLAGAVLQLRPLDDDVPATGCEQRRGEARMQPGETRVFRFSCALLEGADYRIAVSTTPNPWPELWGHLSGTLHARRGLDLAGAGGLSPRLGDETTLRDVTLEVRNRGNGPESVEGEVRVELALVEGESGYPGFMDVTATADVDIAAVQDQAVIDPGSKATLSWILRLIQPGDYRVTALARTSDGLGEVTAIATAGVLVADSRLYVDRFSSTPPPSQAVLGSSDWTPMALRDRAPPATAGVQPERFWEVGPRLPPELVDAYVRARAGMQVPPLGFTPQESVLRGEADAATALGAQGPFDRVRVRFTQYIESPGCDPDDGCAAQLSPEPRFLVRIGQGKPRELVQAPMVNGQSLQEPATVPVWLYQRFQAGSQSSAGWTQSDMHNEGTFLEAQWVPYTFDLPLASVLPSATAAGTTLGAVAAAAALDLEFVLSDRTALLCPQPGPNSFCPTWRVAFAELALLRPDGSAVPLLRTDGTDTDLGTWTSYTATRSGVTVAATPDATGPMTGCRSTASPETGPTEQMGFCSIWVRRPVAELVPEQESLWHKAKASDFPEGSPVALAGGGAWTTAATDSLQYPDGRLELLASPIFRVTQGLDDPVLSFQHKFAFADLTVTPQVGISGPSYQDSGAVMLRLVDPADGHQPLTPFLPVMVRNGASAPVAGDPTANLLGDLFRYTKDDCLFYGPLHPAHDPVDANACKAVPLRARSMATERIHLRDVPVLDFQHVGAAGTLESVGSLVQGASEPDPKAVRVLDLLADCDGPCAFQVALRAQTADPVISLLPPGVAQQGSAYYVRNVTAARLAAFTKAQAPAAGVVNGVGWFLGGASIDGEQRQAHDLAVTGAELAFAYNWTKLGVGPSTDGILNLTVENRGLFPERAVRVVVLDLQPGGGIVASDPFVPEAFDLAPGESTVLGVPLRAPAVAGEHRLLARVDLTGSTSRPGLAITDGAPENNCASIGTGGGQLLGTCVLDQALRLKVEAVPDLAVDLKVTPAAGRSDFPRQVVVRIDNLGNVPVLDADFILSHKGERGSRAASYSYTLKRSPEPGSSADWTLLELVPVPGTGTPARPPSSLTLGTSGSSDRFQVSVALSRGDEFAAFDSVLAEGFQTFYADRFDGSAPITNPRVATGPLSPGPSWTLNSESGVAGSGAWMFGDPQRGRYPDGADSSLLLPPLDLSAVSRASLSFNHHFQLETLQDGGRVEASLDGGATWQVLSPAEGYPAKVSSSSPFNEFGDPRVAEPAFTGESLVLSAPTGGWLTSEFDLGQIKGLTTAIKLIDLPQDGFSNRVLRPGGPDDPVSYAKDWALPGEACPDGCWQRANMRRAEPLPDPSGELALRDGKMWWTDTVGSRVAAGANITSLPLHVELPPRQQDGASVQAALVFWLWADAQGTFQVADNALGVPALAEVRGTTQGWNRIEIPLQPLQTDAARDLTLYFLYTQVLQAVQPAHRASNRGAVVDDASLVTFSTKAGKTTVASQPLPTLAPEWQEDEVLGNTTHLMWKKVAHMAEVPDAWVVDVSAGPDGEELALWAFGGGAGQPASAKERIVTPVLSLKAVGGDMAALLYHESFDMDPREPRRVYIQVFEPTLEGDVPGPWQLLTEAGLGNDASSAWVAKRIDLSQYIGRDIRIAFEAATDRVDKVGSFWRLADVAIEADTLVGRSVLVRLRAATDSSLGDGNWTVDNLQLVGNAFSRNVAVLPEDERPEVAVSRTGTVRLQGSIRNLGVSLVSGLRLQVEAPTGAAVVPITAPPSEFALASAGRADGSDRQQYAFDVTFPNAPLGASDAKVILRLLQAHDDELELLTDDNPGDHQREVAIHIEDLAAVDVGRATIDRPAVVAGESLTAGIPVRNNGTLAATIATSIDFVSLAEGTTIASLSGPVLHLAPGEEGHVRGTWTASGQGLVQVRLRHLDAFPGLTGLPPRSDLVGHALVDVSPIFFRDDFAADPLGHGWAAVSNGNPAEQTDGSADPNSQWRLDALGQTDAASFALGPDAASAAAGITYGKRRDESLLSPGIDLRPLGDLAALPGGPLAPVLTYQYQGDLGRNDGLLVQASSDGVSFQTLAPDPGQAGLGTLTCGVPCNRLALRGNPAIAATTSSWSTYVHALDGKALGGTDEAVGKRLRLAWRFGSDNAGEATGIRIDGVVVAATDPTVLPRQQELVLRNGANKTVHVMLENRGAVRDTFDLQASLIGAPSGTVRLELPRSTLTLDAGQAERIELRLTVPDDAKRTFSKATIQVAAHSHANPGRLLSSIVRIVEFRVDPLSDLDVALQQPFGHSSALTEGELARFLVSVQNSGTAMSRETGLLLVACRDLGDLPSTASACRNGAGPAAVITAAPMVVPALAPVGSPLAGATPSRFSATVDWTPRGLAASDGGPARYVVLAIAAPPEQGLDVNRESNLANNLRLLPVTVARPARADLAVVGVHVRDAEGRDVTSGEEGQLLRLNATFRNIGRGEARDLALALSIQFPLLEAPVARLAPGEEVTLETQWVAQRGNWVFLASGLLAAGRELRSDNNEGRVPLAIRGGAVTATLDPGAIALVPGGSMPLRIAIHNGRTSPLEAALTVDAPQGLAVEGLPDSLQVGRAQDEAVVALVKASPFLAPGSYLVTVVVAPASGGPAVATLALDVDVSMAQPLHGVDADVDLPPGDGSFQTRVANDGDGVAQVFLQVEAPADWAAAPRAARLAVQPHAESQATIDVKVPLGAEPGVHTLRVLANGEAVATVRVHVTAAPAFETIVLGSSQHERGTLVQSRVTNIGNAESMAVIELPTDAVLLTPLRTLAPGESMGADYLLEAPVDAVPDAAPSAELASVPFKAKRGQGVQVGAVVENPSSAPQDVTVRLFVDGRLRGQRVVALGGNASEAVNFTWHAVPGRHLISLTWGDGDLAGMQSTLVEVEHGRAWAPGPSPVAFLGLLALALLARRRRR